MTTNIVIQTSKVLTLELDSSKVQSYLSVCDLKWRKKNLLVDRAAVSDRYDFPAVTRKQWLETCLRNSWIERVSLALTLGERGIKLWADTCDRANKPVFIRIPSNNNLPNCQKTTYWLVKRSLDWLITIVLSLVLSPLILAIALLLKIFTPGPIFFSQWRVGHRGKLFKIYKFRTMSIDAEAQHHQIMGNLQGLHKQENDPRVTVIGKWLRKYSLDELPQLFNVLRGEMSLVGPRPWALYDALRIEKAGRKRLNALPGITGAWQVESRSQLLDLPAVTKCDLEYLSNWSLVGDLKILLLTVPKVISGFGAY